MINEFLGNQQVIELFPRIVKTVQGNFRFAKDFPSEVLAYLVGNNIIEKDSNNATYNFTEKGKQFLLAYYQNLNRE